MCDVQNVLFGHDVVSVVDWFSVFFHKLRNKISCCMIFSRLNSDAIKSEWAVIVNDANIAVDTKLTMT